MGFLLGFLRLAPFPFAPSLVQLTLDPSRFRPLRHRAGPQPRRPSHFSAGPNPQEPGAHHPSQTPPLLSLHPTQSLLAPVAPSFHGGPTLPLPKALLQRPKCKIFRGGVPFYP